MSTPDNAELSRQLTEIREILLTRLPPPPPQSDASAATSLTDRLVGLFRSSTAAPAAAAAAAAPPPAYTPSNTAIQLETVTVTGSASGSVWGSGIYTDDSSQDTAAVHAGFVKPGETKTLRLLRLPGQPSYTPSTSNGITSNSYSAWSGSFAFVAVVDAEGAAAAAAIASLAVQDRPLPPITDDYMHTLVLERPVLTLEGMSQLKVGDQVERRVDALAESSVLNFISVFGRERYSLTEGLQLCAPYNWPVEIIELSDARPTEAKIHFFGYGSNWDGWCPKSVLRPIVKPPLSNAAELAAASPIAIGSTVEVMLVQRGQPDMPYAYAWVRGVVVRDEDRRVVVRLEVTPGYSSGSYFDHAAVRKEMVRVLPM